VICRLARTPAEHQLYFRLRREIFCEEQGIFADSDRDEVDQRAHAIVCLAEDDPGLARTVIGVVRIWESAPGHWWGGRLGVERSHRTLATVGRRLIQTAVGTARAWGAVQFRALVQQPNVAFFRRLHWRVLEPVTVHGQPHQLMEAELAWYQPTAETRPEIDEAA
jgi:putative N-acetyltransferase (TIGR04045 family)